MPNWFFMLTKILNNMTYIKPQKCLSFENFLLYQLNDNENIDILE